MSPQLQHQAVEAFELDAFDASRPLLAADRITLTRRSAGWLASGGRFAVIWLPVFAIFTGQKHPVGHTLLASTVVSAIWFVALRSAFVAARPTILALGSAFAAALGTVTGLVFVSAALMWLPGLHVSSLQLTEMVAAVVVLSAFWEGLVYRSIAARRRVLIVGSDDGAKELVRELHRVDDLPFDLAGIVDEDSFDDLAEIVGTKRPDIVVLAGGEQRSQAFDRLLDVASAGFKVVGLPEFYEYAFSRVPVRHLTPVWFMSVLHLYQRPYTRAAKRTFDVAVAAMGLLATAWVFPLLVLLVKRTPGPAVFRQVRMGEGGKPFTIYKFRSMRQDAEVGGAVWASERDPRITAIGRFMRKTRLDELPQLWNVVKGDMSIVGPRPERPEFMEQLQEAVPFWTRRHLVKPGITGWAQVCRGYTADEAGTEEKLSYDLWYLRHRSLVIDLAVCVKTFSTILTGSGAR